MGLRVRLLLLSLATATPVAAGVLPLDGAYGNDAGCAFYIYGQAPSGDYLLVTPDTLASPKLSCDFGSLLTSSGGHFTLDAVCSPGGKIRIDVEDRGTGGVAVTGDGAVLGPAPRCADVPADAKGTIKS